MRALVRIATPVAVALSGCAFPVDEFTAPARSDAALSTNGDAAHYDDAANDSASDTCVCVKQAAGKCREWNMASCAK
jgi:hypothetical protein